MSKPRLLMGDDHALILEGLRSLLSSDFEVIGVAADGRELVAEAERLRPDAILLDVSMPMMNGIEAASQIKARLPKIKLVIVTQQADRSYVQDAFAVGVSGYILKQSAVSELRHALKEVLANRYYVSPQLRSLIPDALFHPGQNPAELFRTKLTTRQREVLQLVAEGKANKEIGAALNVSIKTVEFHKTRLMEELGIRTTAELTRYAVQHGFVGD